jgi:hypothetical protein
VTFFGMALLTAIGTVVLAVFAVVTAWYARKVFREQSREVAAIEQQVKDGEEVTRQQAELFKVQSGQLELQRQQLEDQRAASVRQAEVLDLEAAELRESLGERKREADRRHGDQASRVFIQEVVGPSYAATEEGGSPGQTISAVAVNTSDQPVYDAENRWRRGSEGYGEPNPGPLGTILPDSRGERRRGFPAGTNMEVSGAVLSFRDAAGTVWMRRPDGGLTEQE